MFEEFGIDFFKALKEVADTRLGADNPCSQAIKNAAETGTLEDMEDARKQMALLPQSVVEPMMAAVHKAMRENPEALLKMWSPGVKPEKFN